MIIYDHLPAYSMLFDLYLPKNHRKNSISKCSPQNSPTIVSPTEDPCYEIKDDTKSEITYTASNKLSKFPKSPKLSKTQKYLKPPSLPLQRLELTPLSIITDLLPSSNNSPTLNSSTNSPTSPSSAKTLVHELVCILNQNTCLECEKLKTYLTMASSLNHPLAQKKPSKKHLFTKHREDDSIIQNTVGTCNGCGLYASQGQCFLFQLLSFWNSYIENFFISGEFEEAQAKTHSSLETKSFPKGSELFLTSFSMFNRMPLRPEHPVSLEDDFDERKTELNNGKEISKSYSFTKDSQTGDIDRKAKRAKTKQVRFSEDVIMCYYPTRDMHRWAKKYPNSQNMTFVRRDSSNKQKNNKDYTEKIVPLLESVEMDEFLLNWHAHVETYREYFVPKLYNSSKGKSILKCSPELKFDISSAEATPVYIAPAKSGRRFFVNYEKACQYFKASQQSSYKQSEYNEPPRAKEYTPVVFTLPNGLIKFHFYGKLSFCLSWSDPVFAFRTPSDLQIELEKRKMAKKAMFPELPDISALELEYGYFTKYAYGTQYVEGPIALFQ